MNYLKEYDETGSYFNRNICKAVDWENICGCV